MNCRVDAQVAGARLGQIIDRAVANSERFIVDRNGEPVVVIMSVKDYIRTVAPTPKWLEEAWEGARQRGIDQLTPEEIDAEIQAYRNEKRG